MTARPAMPDAPLTRRAALRLGAAAAGAVLSSPALAQLGQIGGGSGLPAGLRFRTIAVDTARVAALGNGTGADLVAQALGRNLRTVFADLMAPRDAGGATLVARVSSLYLSSYAGNRDYGGRHGTGAANDDLEGVGIVTSGGRVLAEVPILSVLNPGYSGAWYLPDIDRRRIESISHHFAWWLRREMGV